MRLSLLRNDASLCGPSLLVAAFFVLNTRVYIRRMRLLADQGRIPWAITPFMLHNLRI